MKLLSSILVLCSVTILLAFSCSKKNSSNNGPDPTPQPVDTLLYKAYQNYFPVGAAINAKTEFSNTALMAFIPKHYNSITAENHMKPRFIQPQQNVFDWRYADSTVAYAKRNNMKVRGHTLVWFQSMPYWFFKNTNGTLVTKAELLSRMQTHINAVAGRYQNDVYCWDVVNEAISNNASEIYRPIDTLYTIAGEDYVEMAFRYARAAAPNAKLFYNDYRFSNPVKRQKIYDMLNRLLAKGTPIDGVGMQSHYIPNEITETYLQETIDMFAGLGLKIQVTELDVSVYDYRTPGSPDLNPADDQYTAAREAIQTATYDMLFKVYRRNKGKITGVTFWGAADSRDNFRTNDIGKMDYPFLFDEYLKPKKAFNKVISF